MMADTSGNGYVSKKNMHHFVEAIYRGIAANSNIGEEYIKALTDVVFMFYF